MFRWVAGAIIFGIAALSDIKTRKVSNSIWNIALLASIPFTVVQITQLGADIWTWFTFIGAYIWVLTHTFGVPSIKHARNGSWLDRIFYLGIFIGLLGLTIGSVEHVSKIIHIPWMILEPIDPNSEYATTRLWLMSVGIILSIPFIELLWKIGALRGGADAKAMMIICLLLPTWYGLPIIFHPETLPPPFISVAIWSGFAMIMILPYVMIKNLAKGVRSPISMIWHAEKIPISEFKADRMWLLSTIISDPSGNENVTHRMRPVARTIEDKWTEETLERLLKLNEESIWITYKHPYIFYIAIAWIAIILAGDIISHIIPMML